MLPPKMPKKDAVYKAGDYSLIQKFPGYHAREDPTTLPAGTLIAPSQNVRINTSGRVALVPGYVLDGVGSSVADSGILSNYDFTNFKGDVRNLRAGFLSSEGADGRLQYRYIDASGTVNWVNLMTGLSRIRLCFCDFSDTTNLVKDVLWVDGSNNIFAWNGAVTTFASASNATGYITALNATPTNGGTGYVVGDTLAITGGSATAIVTSVSGSSAGAIITYSISGGGTGYAVNDTVFLTVTTAASWLVTSVDASGKILSLQLISGGSGFATQYYSITGGGSGTGLQVLVGSVGGQTITGVSLVTTDSGYSSGTGKATTGGSGTGATLNITSVGNYSITKQDSTKTWAQEGFVQTNGSVTVGSAVLGYALAIGQTLVGISADPTVPAFAVGTITHQTPVTSPLSGMTAILATFGPTIIGCGRNNQVYIGASNSTNLYISKVNTYTDYSFTTPVRVVGEGDLIPLDAPPTKFVPQEVDNSSDLAYDMYISEGRSTWSVIRSTLSTDLSKETLEHIRLKVSPLQGALSERLVAKMKNEIMYVGYDSVANFLGLMSYQYVPAIVDFSFPIIDDMSSYDFTDGSIFYYENFVLIAIPKEGLIRLYNMTDQTGQYTSFSRDMEDVTKQPWFWEAPITYPLSGFYVDQNGDLYGHSYTTSESYKLFTGGSLNGQNIIGNATFAFDDKGDRTQSKASDELWAEGYISQNTILTATVAGDLDAAQQTQTVTIVGSDPTIVAYGGGAHSLGKNNLGSQPLGGAAVLASALPAWFHVAKTYNEQSFYLEQVSFETNGVDLDWELITFGTNAKFTNEGNNDITQ